MPARPRGQFELGVRQDFGDPMLPRSSATPGTSGTVFKSAKLWAASSESTHDHWEALIRAARNLAPGDKAGQAGGSRHDLIETASAVDRSMMVTDGELRT